MKSILHAILIIMTTLACSDDLPKKSSLNRCDLEPDAGPCKALFTMYYFDKGEGKCKPFAWGGCHGTVPFETIAECEQCVADRVPIQ